MLTSSQTETTSIISIQRGIKAIDFDETAAARLDALVCGICLQYPLLPVRAPDCGGSVGHIFCRACLRQAMQDRQQCPTCRRPLSAEWMASVPADSMLQDELDILCWSKTKHSLNQMMRLLSSPETVTIECLIPFVRDINTCVCILDDALRLRRFPLLGTGSTAETTIHSFLEQDEYSGQVCTFDRQKPEIRVALAQLAARAGWLTIKGYHGCAIWAQYSFDVIYDCCEAGDLGGVKAACDAYTTCFSDSDWRGDEIYWTTAFPRRRNESCLFSRAAAPSAAVSILDHPTAEPVIPSPDFRLAMFAALIAVAPRAEALSLSRAAGAYCTIVRNTFCRSFAATAIARPEHCIPVPPRLNQSAGYGYLFPNSAFLRTTD